MQSKMTERDFRMVLQVAVMTGFDDAVKRAREAGLEFAPEPKLPERLTPELSCGKPNWCWLNEAGERVLDLSLSLTSSEKTREKEIVTAAFERANAYPGLRAAAENLVEHLRSKDLYGLPITKLEAELAKGPK